MKKATFSAYPLILALWSTTALSEANLSSLNIDPTVMSIQDNRSDLEADTLMMQIYCLKENENRWDSYDCANVTVDGKTVDGFWTFPSSSKNQFSLPTISIQPRQNVADIVCVGLKVLFRGCAAEEGCSNTYDYQLYQDQEDRYSVLSYCNNEADLPEQFADVAFFSHRRVRTFDKFKQNLHQIILNLNPKR